MGAGTAKARMAPTAPSEREDSSWWAAPTITWKPTSFCRVLSLPTTVMAADDGFDGGLSCAGADSSRVGGSDEAFPDDAADPAREATLTSSLLCFSASTAAAWRMRGVTASKVSVTLTCLRIFKLRAPSTTVFTLSRLPLDSLMPMILGWLASSMMRSAVMSYPVHWGKL